MPVCVYCARHNAALHTTLGSGHVVLVRCACGNIADPYLEYGPTAVFLDFVLAKPRAYRHVLFNSSHRRTIPATSISEPAAMHTELIWTHARRALAVLLVESYLTWFYVCVQKQSCSAAFPGATLLPSAILGPVRVFLTTLVDILAQHTAVAATCFVAARIPPLIPSMALLFSRASTLLLCALLLVWDSELPLERRTRGSIPLPLGVPMLDMAWVVRVLMGGMSAGVALGVVLNGRPAAAAAALLTASLIHLGVSTITGLHDT
mgnify:CR=1 FL=1